MNKQIEQLLNSLLGDCIHAETATDLYNALVRLEKGSDALLKLTNVMEALDK